MSAPHRPWQHLFGPRVIVHVDMDAFFAQVEAMDYPEYRGKPLIVGGLKTSARGVVSTCSYEARAFGVRSAMPIQQAVKLCPHGIFIPTRMGRYEEVSRSIRKILAEMTPVVEPISIDEAFLDMSGCEHFYVDPFHLGREIKGRLRDATGLTASVGVAPNKFLAKLASDYRKPDGLTVLTKEQIDDFLKPLPVHALWGVGPKTAHRLEKAGIVTVADVRRRPRTLLARIVGARLADHVIALARGQDERPVEPLTPAKSLGREMTFEKDVAAGPELKAHLAQLTAEVGLRLRQQRLYARTVTLKIRYPDFKTHTKSHTLDNPFSDDDTLFREASKLLHSFQLQRPLRLIGVYVSHFQEHGQASLFFEPEDRLTAVVDTLNRRLGRRAVRKGRELTPQPRQDHSEPGD